MQAPPLAQYHTGINTSPPVYFDISPNRSSVNPSSPPSITFSSSIPPYHPLPSYFQVPTLMLSHPPTHTPHHLPPPQYETFAQILNWFPNTHK